MRTVLLLATLLAGSAASAQWEMQDPHVTANLRGIDYVGGGVAWASGSHGTVLRTEDMGFVWQLCATPLDAKDLDFRGVQAFDNNTAIVMSSGPGDKSRLYKTTDGCQTWKLVFTNPDKDGFWDAVQIMRPLKGFSSETGAIIVGDPVGQRFSLFRSVDEGTTWKRWGGKQAAYGADHNERLAEAENGEALFAASNEALALWTPDNYLFVTGGTTGARVLYSDERGACQELGGTCSLKFAHVDLTTMSKGRSAGAFAIASKGRSSYFPLRLMVVGGDYSKPDLSPGTSVFLASRDAAHIPFTSYFDVVSPTTPPHGYRSAVAYNEKAKAWITVGPNGTDVSTDDGRNWRALKPGPGDAPDADKNWNALSLPFVVGPKGRMGILRDSALGSASGKDLDAKGAKGAK